MSELTPQPDFTELTSLIHERSAKVTRLVNRELIDLYWEMGTRIHQRIAEEAWGKSTVSQLADHLSAHIPGLRGFSASNLWRMSQFYETWCDTSEELVTLSRDLSWSGHLAILGKCKIAEEREFYLRYAIREQFSVRDLRRAIDSSTFERVALADGKLATLSRELDHNTHNYFKDSYLVEFLNLPATHSESDLRKGLASTESFSS